MTPFFANYARHPKSDPFTHLNSSYPSINEYHEELLATQELLKRTLEEAKTDYKTFSDARRIPVPFSINDQVMLNSKFIQTNRPSKKLDSKRLGPFLIIDQINPVAFRLQLPPSMKIHDVFHCSLLEKFSPSTITTSAMRGRRRSSRL
jgi:hypothetical protein